MPRILRQLLSFGAVGIAATVAHVGVAFILIGLEYCPPLRANLFGAGAAYFVSFFGNAAFTFRLRSEFASAAFRYAIITVFSAILTSAILLLVQSAGLPIFVYLALVLVIAPPATFAFSKFWAFRTADRADALRDIAPPHGQEKSKHQTI
ncbi:GtrA family protein [Altererythrobacter aurantiacus]|uniref:GtrA family protein n=1 Tax=Parapontixanthobacter aurantiacus TaxID=1463599 RepID=A0A844ZMU9_9SPHN|nr:GtrA family protein [Parapontixanthobacter aurantiacus]MXO86979.1 GtrA family protein [Parapontixanthobacter aurantiacus]